MGTGRSQCSQENFGESRGIQWAGGVQEKGVPSYRGTLPWRWVGDMSPLSAWALHLEGSQFFLIRHEHLRQGSQVWLNADLENDNTVPRD